MRIELDALCAVAGGRLTGKVLDDTGRPVGTPVWLERRESNGTVTLPASGVEFARATSDASTGAFALDVPPDALPTQAGTRAAIDWMVVTKGKASVVFGEQLARVEIANPHPPDPPAALLATAGTDPPKLRSLIGEHFLSMFMGFFLFAGIAAFCLYAWFGSPENPPPPALPIVLLVVSLFPLASALLAIRTVWPRRPAAPELEIEPAVAHAGDTITVRHVGGRLTPVRFVSIESYMGTYLVGRTGASVEAGAARSSGQFETFEAYRRELRFDETATASFEIPRDAAPSFTGKTSQVRWVVQVGGRKILRWGPISLREWHVVVVDDAVDAAALAAAVR